LSHENVHKIMSYFYYHAAEKSFKAFRKIG